MADPFPEGSGLRILERSLGVPRAKPTSENPKQARMHPTARHLETAAFFARDLKRPDEAARLYEEAATGALWG